MPCGGGRCTCSHSTTSLLAFKVCAHAAQPPCAPVQQALQRLRGHTCAAIRLLRHQWCVQTNSKPAWPDPHTGGSAGRSADHTCPLPCLRSEQWCGAGACGSKPCFRSGGGGPEALVQCERRLRRRTFFVSTCAHACPLPKRRSTHWEQASARWGAGTSSFLSLLPTLCARAATLVTGGRTAPTGSSCA